MTKFINSSGSLHLNIYIEQVSQDIANNSSRVSWKATVDRDGAYHTYTYGNISNLSVWLNGSSVHSSHPDFDTSGQEFTLASGEVTIPHSGDGTKTFAVWASFDPNNGVHGNITVSANYTLSSILRSSSISDNALSGNRQLGSLHTLTIDRKSNSFTHQVWYRVFGSDWIDLGKNHATSVSFAPNIDLARYNTKAKSGTMDICVRTYNGTTQVGNDVYSNGWYFEIPESVKPTFSGLTLTDMNTVARQLLSGNNFLQIISDIQVNFNNPSGAYGSTITGYHAEIVNKNQVTTENGGRLGMMNFNGSATIRASVVDSRGRQSDTRDITINVIEYFAPAFSFTAFRTRETPNIIQVVRNAKIAPITLSGTQKNVMTLSFKVAQLGSTTFTADHGSASGIWTTQHTLNNSAANMAGNYPSNKSFVIIGKLEDKFTSTEFTATVATESVVMSYDKDGRVGVGKVAEQGDTGSLDVLGDIYARNKPIQQYQLTDNRGFGKLVRQDFNNMKSTGFWWLDGSSPNNPFNGAWGMLEVFRPNPTTNEAIQRFTTSSGYMAVRELGHDNVWRPWRYLVQQSKSTNNSDYVALLKSESEPTSWRDLSLKSGWQHHPGYTNVQYSKSFDGVVYIRGSARGGKIDRETVITTLPIGFRPTQVLYLSAINNSYSMVTLAIFPNGDIVVKNDVDSNWLNFDNVSFKI